MTQMFKCSDKSLYLFNKQHKTTTKNKYDEKENH